MSKTIFDFEDELERDLQKANIIKGDTQAKHDMIIKLELIEDIIENMPFDAMEVLLELEKKENEFCLERDSKATFYNSYFHRMHTAKLNASRKMASTFLKINLQELRKIIKEK